MNKASAPGDLNISKQVVAGLGGQAIVEARTERCPYCGQPITRNQLLEIRTNVRREVAAEARAEYERRRAQLEARYDQKVRQEVGKREKALNREFERLRRRLTAGQEALENERRNFAKREALAVRRQQMAEAELRKREKRIDEEARRRVAELVEREHARFEADSAQQRSAFEKERLQWRRKEDGLEKQVDVLKRRLEEKTAHALEEYSVDALLSDLQDNFREDRVERLERGRNVGDVRQVVLYRGQEVGVIIYELKNVKSWLNAFLEQAKHYRTVHNTPHVVVVSTALPGKSKNLTIKDGVLVVSPEHAILVARLIRDGIVAMAKAKLSAEQREAKVAQLYAYLTSDDYRQRAEGVVEGVRKLRELQTQEQEAHRRTWQKQEQQHKKIDADIGEVNSKVEAIIESEVPSVDVRPVKRRKKPSLTEVAATP